MLNSAVVLVRQKKGKMTRSSSLRLKQTEDEEFD